MSRPIEITSSQNPWIRRFRRALDKHRDEIVLEGPRFVADAIERGHHCIAVAVRRSAPLPRIGRDVAVLELAEPVFREISDSITSQGTIGLFARPASDWSRVDWASPLVVLDAVQDPGNVGTIVRLAAAFEAGALLCADGTADPWGPKSLRASVGAILDVPIVRASAIEIRDRLNDARVPRFVTDAAGDPVGNLRLEPGAVIFGNEGAGVSDVLREGAQAIAIPMSDRVESLNVASAAAIVLSRQWELRRGLAPASLVHPVDATD